MTMPALMNYMALLGARTPPLWKDCSSTLGRSAALALRTKRRSA